MHRPYVTKMSKVSPDTPDTQGFMPQTSTIAMNPPSLAARSVRSAKNARIFSHQRADLTLEEDGSVFRAKIDGELASVLVDTEVEHRRVSLKGFVSLG